MNTYFLFGLVLPERAQISHEFSIQYTDFQSEHRSEARVSIVLNQMVVRVKSLQNWNVFDLRNSVDYLIRSRLAIIGFYNGIYYDFHISRVINEDFSLDYVFGIDTKAIVEYRCSSDTEKNITAFIGKATGVEGIFLSRCLTDLMFAMKYAIDTPFYCYRAIETLRHHCALKYGLEKSSEKLQWGKLREVAKCDRADIDFVKDLAEPIRHGQIVKMTGNDIEQSLLKTWNLVDAYLAGI